MVAGIGDFDGDRKSDILWRNSGTDQKSLWRSGSSATPQAVTTLADQSWQMADEVESGDLLTGGTGSNTLYGTVWNDLLQGGLGNDTLT